MSSRPILLFLVSIALQLRPAAAGIDDLWITEVVPGTGEVEVTNIGAEAVTLQDQIAFCHRFRYSDRIDGGTSFAAGESKVFTLNLSSPADSDLWLYRTTSRFSTAANIITGIKWGSTTDIGRTGIASAAGKWSGVASFVPAPARGMALQLTGPDPFSNLSWSEGVPDLGNYSLQPEPQALLATLSLAGETLVFEWSGGAPPYLIRSSRDLKSWQSEGVTSEMTRTFERSLLDSRAFLQVAPASPSTDSASYRITFQSVWSPDVFQSVPGSAHFSGLIGMTHNDQVSLWRPGELASPGIESMAETGSKSTLSGEISTALTAGSGGVELSGGGLGGSGSMTTLDFTVSISHPQVSLVSMIAPSPDWFVGVHDLPLIGADGEWVDSLSIDLVPYDSGTDDGIDFTSPNAESNPHLPIFQIAGTPPFALRPTAGDPPRGVATFLIERLP
jgi:hypothetical protein